MDQETFDDFSFDELLFEETEQLPKNTVQLEALKLDDDFSFDDDFFSSSPPPAMQPPPATAHDETDLEFEWPHEITAEDLDRIEAEERAMQLEKRQKKQQALPAAQVLDPSLEMMQELSAQRQLIMAKEGEITILRQKLREREGDYMSIAAKYAEMSQYKSELEKKHENSLKRLKDELYFREQELKMMSARPRKQTRKVDLEFELVDREKERPLERASEKALEREKENVGVNMDYDFDVPTEVSLPVVKSTTSMIALSDWNLFSFVCQKLMDGCEGSLKECEILDIVKARQVARSEICKKQGKLVDGMIALLSFAIKLRQSRLLLYAVQVLELLSDWFPDRLYGCSGEKDSKIYELLAKILLDKRVLIEAVPKDLLTSALICLQVILFRSGDWKLPTELSGIISSGLFHWLLRAKEFDAADLSIICGALYSISRDSVAACSLFLTSDFDKIASESLLDVLLGRCKAGLKAPNPGMDDLLQVDAIASLLFSFLHRQMGPCSLWITDELLQLAVEWILLTIEDDLREGEGEEEEEKCKLIPIPVLLARETLLETLLEGVHAAWLKTGNLAPILTTNRMPFCGALRMLLTGGVNSFDSERALMVAQQLLKLVERQVADDMRSLYESQVDA